MDAYVEFPSGVYMAICFLGTLLFTCVRHCEHCCANGWLGVFASESSVLEGMEFRIKQQKFCVGARFQAHLRVGYVTTLTSRVGSPAF